jgi:hypothetical protein
VKKGKRAGSHTPIHNSNMGTAAMGGGKLKAGKPRLKKAGTTSGRTY